ncbi:hypothetical protein GEV33_005264 [Tenebrio molitor]|uniref:Uncharacterized protein n=1 Tax=Tenebrio molitor TaxID=7067 RepID=A0A8J6HNL0_TENMO|nr:hypothetical protein GEV33_005264 [Tenebrio molitor]
MKVCDIPDRIKSPVLIWPPSVPRPAKLSGCRGTIATECSPLACLLSLDLWRWKMREMKSRTGRQPRSAEPSSERLKNKNRTQKWGEPAKNHAVTGQTRVSSNETHRVQEQLCTRGLNNPCKEQEFRRLGGECEICDSDNL